MRTIDPLTIPVADHWPDRFHPESSEKIPADLAGAEIVRLGAVGEKKLVEGGGLVIDYRPKQSGRTRRLVLAFNELGMWEAANITLPQEPSPA